MTISIPKELHEKMKKHSEVKWSEVARRSLAEYLEKLTPLETIDASDLLNIINETGVSIDTIPLSKASKHAEKMRNLEWKRASTTQTS